MAPQPVLTTGWLACCSAEDRVSDLRPNSPPEAGRPSDLRPPTLLRPPTSVASDFSHYCFYAKQFEVSRAPCCPAACSPLFCPSRSIFLHVDTQITRVSFPRRQASSCKESMAMPRDTHISNSLSSRSPLIHTSRQYHRCGTASVVRMHPAYDSHNLCTPGDHLGYFVQDG